MSNFGVNPYIVTAENMDGVLIDAPYGGESIVKTVMEKGIELKMILLTHGHCDHIASAAHIAAATGAKIYIHKFDEDKLRNDRTNLTQYFSLPPIDPVENANTVNDGDVITMDELEFEVLHTPGHTSGSVCYILGDNMFCGDTLFNGSMGNVYREKCRQCKYCPNNSLFQNVTPLIKSNVPYYLVLSPAAAL